MSEVNAEETGMSADICTKPAATRSAVAGCVYIVLSLVCAARSHLRKTYTLVPAHCEAKLARLVPVHLDQLSTEVRIVRARRSAGTVVIELSLCLHVHHRLSDAVAGHRRQIECKGVFHQIMDPSFIKIGLRKFNDHGTLSCIQLPARVEQVATGRGKHPCTGWDR
eukprot:5205799-Prymnesium_polylepis.1